MSALNYGVVHFWRLHETFQSNVWMDESCSEGSGSSKGASQSVKRFSEALHSPLGKNLTMHPSQLYEWKSRPRQSLERPDLE
jgi:hypothetical protein